jgi:hypothetical protein
MKRRSIGRALVVAATCLLIASGCTITRNAHYQVDLVPGPGYHFHVYRKPTLMIWFTHDAICQWDAACTLNIVRDQLVVNGIFNTIGGLDKFFDDDVADFDDALRSTPHPWPLSVNLPEQYGCLGGYKNLLIPQADGDWYGDPPHQPWCHLGEPIR